VVVLSGSPPGLDARLARAGLTTVTFDPETPSGLEIVLDALERRALGVEADRCALLEPRTDGSIAVALVAGGVRTPGVIVRDVEAVVPWLARHLV
jgi:hypothetical protein